MLRGDEIVRFLHKLNYLSVVLRIGLAMLCGGALGIERGKTNQPAGMRTYMLVCMGSAVVMMTGQYTYTHFESGDPARLGAQVISGIGFLGAGSIVSIKAKVKGLTTAAGLWVSACIGLGIGIGFYTGAIAATVAVYLTITKFKTVENVFTAYDTWLQAYIKFDSLEVIPEFSRALEEKGMILGEIQLNKKQSKNYTSAVVMIKNPKRMSREEIMDFLSEQKGVHSLALLP